MISTSPIRISCVVPRRARARRRARAAHRLRALGRGHDPPGRAVRAVQLMRIAVVGATGAVGTIMRRLARERFAADELVAFASERSAGRTLDDGLVVQPLRDDTIEGFDLALFSAGAGTQPRVGAALRRRGRDRRRQLERVPHGPRRPAGRQRGQPGRDRRAPRKGIVANPNCTTMVVMLPAKALHDALRAERDGRHELPGRRRRGPEGHRRAGRAGRRGRRGRRPARQRRRGRRAQGRALASTRTRSPSTSCRCSARSDDNGYTDEEMKLQNESRKILEHPGPRRDADLRARAGDGRPLDRGPRDVRPRGRPRPRRSRRSTRSRTSSSRTRRRRWSGPGRDETVVGRVRATSPTRACSTSSSSATTCSRAPR